MCAGPTTYPHKHGRAHQRSQPRARASPSSPHCLPFLLSPTFFFLFSGEEARRRRVMSSSSADSRQWRKYGPVPLTRCPNCPRMEPLKRLTCVKKENGNRGRDFVKCLSRPQPGQVRSVYFTNRPIVWSISLDFFLFSSNLGGGSRVGSRVHELPSPVFQVLEQCGYFEWLDDYVERLKLEGSTQGPLAPLAVEHAPHLADRSGQCYGQAELGCELKKIGKQLKQVIDLKQQANMMAGAFYCCVIAMGFFYLMFINR